MEHHPLWHVGIPSLDDEVTQVHEAAHGWFGGGIRIACWEDFVLSEGTVTYLAARAIEEAVGPAAGAAVWLDYVDTLDYVLAYEDGIAWPEGCGEVDILADGLFSLSPYYKGAFFYLAVADEVGADELDAVLGSFFEQYVGDAAGMQDMLDHIEAETGFDPSGLAHEWLRTLGAPE
jgi:aminopeptidase N